MTWIPPEQDPSNRLFLPVLGPDDGSTPVLKSPEDIDIQVDDPFLSVWQAGPDGHDPKSVQDALAVLVQTFGRLAVAAQGKVAIFQKTSRQDLVTDVDRGIEMLLRIWIRRNFKNHAIVGEEGPKDQVDPNGFSWFIDPIDGTSNFANQDEHFGINVGVFEAGEPVAAVIGVPVWDTYFGGYRGLSHPICYQNGREVPFQAMPAKQLVVGTEYLDGSQRQADLFSQVLDHLSATPYRIRSITVNLVKFLLGEVTLFYKPRVKLWDVFAPLAIHYFIKDPQYRYYLDFLGNLENLFDLPPQAWDKINRILQEDGKTGLLVAGPLPHSDILVNFVKNRLLG